MCADSGRANRRRAKDPRAQFESTRREPEPEPEPAPEPCFAQLAWPPVLPSPPASDGLRSKDFKGKRPDVGALEVMETRC